MVELKSLFKLAPALAIKYFKKKGLTSEDIENGIFLKFLSLIREVVTGILCIQNTIKNLLIISISMAGMSQIINL